MKFQNTQVWGFEHAIRGMRNPKNSWHLSDSDFAIANINDYDGDYEVANEWIETLHPELNWSEEYSDEGYKLSEEYSDKLIRNGVLRMNESDGSAEFAMIGPNDMKLAQMLIKGGPEHRKFLRQIFVSVDITAPLYIWKELDTYKISTVANSTSTMHKLTSKPITLDCFEIDDWNPELVYYDFVSPDGTVQAENTIEMLSDFMIEQLEFLRQRYLETKDKRYWKELVRWLPEGWLQKRTWTANYETIRSICHQRAHHKLNEWAGIDNSSKTNFISWAKELPYADYFIFDKEDPFHLFEK